MDSAISEQQLTDETVQGRQMATSDRQHETREADMKLIVIGAVALVAMVTAVSLALWALLHVFLRHPAVPPTSVSPLALVPETPPPPRLEVQPRADYQAFLRAEETELNGYGWANSAHTVVHIPIEKAKQLLLTQGVPTRVQPEQQTYDSNAAEASGTQPAGVQAAGAQRLGIGPTGRSQ